MTAKKSRFQIMRKSPYQRALARFIRWARGVNLRAKFEIFLAVLSLALASATAYFFYQRAGPFGMIEGDFEILLHITIATVLVFAGFVGHRLVRLLGGKGGRLQGRIITYFGMMAVIPVVILVIFSHLILERGMQNWFSERVRATLNNSLDVAETYLAEHRMNIQGDLLAMAYDINSQAMAISRNNRLLQVLVEDQMAKRSLNEAMVFDGSGNLLAQASTNLTLAPQGVPRDIIQRVSTGDVVILSETESDRVKAYVKLESFLDAYLYVSRFVDPAVLGHLQATRDALAEYETLEAGRGDIQFDFDLVFGVIAVFLLLMAVWLGYIIAGSMTNPIKNLAGAAEKVGQGKFRTKLPPTTARDEIGTLSRAFSRMTRKLESQQKDLKTKNRQMDERRRFTEAVLAGVSAGVIGLDKRGNINLPNRSACDFFDKTRNQLEGKRMLTLMPELKTLLCRVMDAGDETAQGQVTVNLEGKERTLLVKIAAEITQSKVGGYVITFDDITDQLSDQRTAAWADVARRIAHEIKNPLTPIQLSAERLRRKYKKSFSEEDPVFEKCTETIIRQVGDLRRMVDEFSSFARMPKPVFKEENLTDIVRQALFLQEVGAPNIKFRMKAPKQPIKLNCDSRQLSQAMTNLMKNAIESISEKSSGKGKKSNGKTIGNIDIKIEKQNGQVEVLVEDDGIGFPEETMEKLVEPYVTTREKGTGLGLAIVRKIMEDHYGQIILSQRKKGAGARVTLVFDLDALSKRPAKTESGGGEDKKNQSTREKVSGHGA